MNTEATQNKNSSPIAPYLSLEQSLALIGDLKKAGLQNATFNRHLSFQTIGSGSGASIRKLASLGYYGLLEKAGIGEYKIARDAIKVLLDVNLPNEENLRLKKKFALAPDVFKKLHSQFGAEVVNEDTLSGYLQVNYDPPFNEANAVKVAKNYLVNFQFAKLGEESGAGISEQIEHQSDERGKQSGSIADGISGGIDGWTTLIDRPFRPNTPNESFKVICTGEIDDSRLKIIADVAQKMADETLDSPKQLTHQPVSTTDGFEDDDNLS
ncbi:hypothetical protein HIMB100_00013310 [SAR116 cluster alpha proteobacterium HIMB100]|nr:hypothetical protein HIMB100_00013310 [SAR116 cluster alpha proteobacterium HIMB100]